MTRTMNPRKSTRTGLAVGLLLAALGVVSGGATAADATADLDKYNVVWDSPSVDATGSMPIGNGQVGMNVWVEKDGDLRFYISRNDSLSEVSQLCKVGRVRVALSPNPFAAGKPFRQELKLRDGRIEIRAGDVKLMVFVDPSHPVIYVTGESRSPVSVKATAESWRTTRRDVRDGASSWTLMGSPTPVWEGADVFPEGLTDAVAWYHRNEESTAFASTMRVQSLESVADKAHDPLILRTFGGWMTGEGFKAVKDHAIATPAPVRTFELRVAAPCAQTAKAEEWLELARKEAAGAQDALGRTAAHWRSFWSRSWVFADGNPLTTPEIPGKHHPLHIGEASNETYKFPGIIERTKAEFEKTLRLEAWIKPDQLVAGRIFEKRAAGNNGFLLDTHPGDSLRFIVGDRTVKGPRGILKVGEWHHIVASFDPVTGAMSVRLNDKFLLDSVAGHGMTVPVGRAYTLQRYMMACAGGGPYPIKFNGSIFTVEYEKYSPDWRKWGDCHWWQNVRLSYHAMLPGGDGDLIRPLFNLYESVRPLCEARAKLYHGVQGAYFPETMTVWGTYANGDYGWNRRGKQPSDVDCAYWRYARNQGPELVALMLDYWDYTRDEAFVGRELLPMAESVLKYFDTRFKKDGDGRVVLDPTQAAETYWDEVINDMPTVAGLNDITARLAALPDGLATPEQSAFFARMKAACPIVPVKDGKLTPAQKFLNKTRNVENPELYAIFPFRLYGLSQPNLEVARETYKARRFRRDLGWGWDGNCAALLGLTGEAVRILTMQCANSNAGYRWPASWGPNHDWIPDQTHGANLLSTTQLMLLQAKGDKILLLPAWPKEWDVSFKLHAPSDTTVEAEVQGGKLVRLVVTPEARRGNVVICPPFAIGTATGDGHEGLQ